MRAPPAEPHARGPRPAAPARDWDNDSRPVPGHQPGDLHRQRNHRRAFRRERRPPRPPGSPAGLLPAGRPYAAAAGRPRPEPAGCDHPRTRCPGRPSAQSPHCGPRGARAQAPRQALPAPYRPPRARGRGHCPAASGAGLAWLVSTVTEPATGRICVLTGNRRNQLPSVSYVPNRLLRSNTSLP
jgi:hypothetical protein